MDNELYSGEENGACDYGRELIVSKSFSIKKQEVQDKIKKQTVMNPSL
jgi:hypothetical protein